MALTNNQKYQLISRVGPARAALSGVYDSNPASVTSDQLGVTVLARDNFPGIVYVTDLGWYAASTGTMWKRLDTLVQVGVTDPVTATGVSLSPMTFTLSIGASQILTPSVTPSGALQTVTYTVSDPSAVSVAGNTITRIGGTTGASVSVTATTINGFTATSVITLVEAPSVRALATFDPIYYNTDTHATYTGYCSYSSDTIGGGAVTDLIASFNLWYIADSNNTGTDTEIPNGATVEAVIQALGKSYQFTFGGATTKALLAGANDVQSDSVSVQTAFGQASLPVGTIVKKKIKVTLPAAASVLPIGLKNTAYVNSDNAFWYDPATLTPHPINTVGPWASTGTGFSNRNNPFSYRLLGKGAGIAMTVIGDSLTAGFKDTLTGNLFGSMHRGLATLPTPPAVISLAVSGVMSTYGSTSAKISNLMKYATGALYLAPGTNDIPGVNAATLITRIDQRISQWKAAGGVGKVLVRRLFPRTGSTDSWATLANQSTTQFAGWELNGIAAQYNALLTTPKYDAVFTTTASRDTTEPLKWVVNGSANYATTDGTHPTPALAALEAPLMASFFQANGIGG